MQVTIMHDIVRAVDNIDLGDKILCNQIERACGLDNERL